MVTFPYNTTDFSYTLEDVFILFSTVTADTYFDLTVTINYFDFYSSIEKTKELSYKIPLINLQQKYNIGRKIHRYLANNNAYSNTFGFQYQTSKVTFLAKEYAISDNTEVSSATLVDVLFIAGTKPTIIENNNAILTKNNHFERITKNGFFICNFLLSAGNHTIKVFKNATEVQSEDIEATAEDNVFSKKIVVKDFSGAKGDVFEVVLVDSVIKKTFVVFPDNEHSKQLVFVDDFKLFRSLECTGQFSFLNEFEQIKHKYKRDLKEILEIVETEQLNKLKLNTGWLLKTDTETITSLLLSTKIYLIENNEAVLELVPIAKKQTAEDSLAELYAYDLEFQINKTNA